MNTSSRSWGDYRDSHQHKGAAYSAFWTENEYAATLWDIEQGLIHRAIRTHLPIPSIRHLDFACGTGRILINVSSVTKLSVGVDVSESMLAIARRDCPAAKLLRADICDAPAFLPGAAFDVITAFRFFLNAEHHLRVAAVKAIAALLATDGIVIFNNHRNYDSVTYRALRAMGRPESDLLCMKHEEVLDLVQHARLKVIATYHAGLLPGTEQRCPVPRRVLQVAEHAVARVPGVSRWCNDVIYVCRHQ